MSHNRRITILKWIAALILLLALLILAIRASGKRTLRNAYAALEAAGRPMTLEEIIPDPFSLEDDAASLIMQAAELLSSDIISSNELCNLFPGMAQHLAEYDIYDRSTNQDESNPYWDFIYMIDEDSCTVSVFDLLPALFDSEFAENNPVESVILTRNSVALACELTKKAAERKTLRGDTDYTSGAELVIKHYQQTEEISTILLCYAANSETAPHISTTLISNAVQLAFLQREEPLLLTSATSTKQFSNIILTIQEKTATSQFSPTQINALKQTLQLFDSNETIHHALDGDRIILDEWAVRKGAVYIVSTADYSNIKPGVISPPEEGLGIFSDLDRDDKLHCLAWNTLFKAADQATCLYYYKRMHELVEQPYSLATLNNERRGILNQPKSFILVHDGLGWLPEAIVSHFKTVSRSRLMRIGLTAIAHQQEHGTFPESIEQMNMQHLLDPFSEKPFIYKPSPDGFLLYSIGPDQIDDAGENDDIPWQHSVPET